MYTLCFLIRLSIYLLYVNDLLWQRQKVLIQVKPLVILGRPRGSRLDVGLLRNVKLLGRVLARNVALANGWLRSLRDDDLAGLLFAADEVLPEAVAFGDDLARSVGVLELASVNDVQLSAAEDLVVLYFY